MQPIALTSLDEQGYHPLLKVDKLGHFVLIWTSENDRSIHGMTFSSELLQWSDPVQLSPEGTKCSATSFDLTNSHGAIGAISYEDPSKISINAISVSID